MNRAVRASLGAVLIGFALGPASLSGQLLRGYVGGGGGLVSPAGSFGDVDKVGWHVVLVALRPPQGSLGFTIDALYGQTAHRDDAGHTTLGGGSANVAVFLAREPRRIRPFVAGGLGAFRVNVDVPGFGSAASTKLALSAGVGVLVGSGGSGGRRGFLVARYVSVRTAPESTTFIPISAGIVFPVGAR